MKFSAWAIFVPVWMLLVVYVPVFKWVYGGWLGERGSLDFAGGTAIHVNAGIAALAAVLVLGKRKGWPGEGHPPHSMPLVMIGTGILWFGWFGFNAGSALAANGQAVQAFMNTFLAAAAAGLAWASSSGCATATSPTWVWRRASSPAWWPSPRRAGYVSRRCRRSFIGLPSPAWSAASPCS
jgi:ammonia channel protein AmtB